VDQRLKLAGMVVALGFLYTAYEFYCFYSEEVPNLTQQRQSLEADFAQKQSEYLRLRSFVQNIESIKGELRELSQQLKTALEYMPPEFKFAELLRRLTALAQNSGVELVQFLPENSEVRPEGSFYATTNIGFEVHGAFAQCLLFLDQVSRLKRIINVNGITLEPLQERIEGAEVKQDRTAATKINAKGTLITYRFAE